MFAKNFPTKIFYNSDNCNMNFVNQVVQICIYVLWFTHFIC